MSPPTLSNRSEEAFQNCFNVRNTHKFLNIQQKLYSHGCDKSSDCTNTQGSYFCTCQPGYHGNGKTCIENDACIGNRCGPMGLCINLLTHHICECNDGYFDSAGDGMGPCLDINECDSDQDHTLSTMGVSVKRTSNNCDKQTTECFNLDMDSKI